MEKKMGMLLAAAVFNMAALMQTAAGAAAPAIYAFGDSLADVGNNNFLPASSKTNFLPYGIDFPGGVPTGRYTNGYNEIDHLAKELGFQQSPPAFLSISSPAEAQGGVNFASGGAGILDITGQNVSIPFNQQIRNFQAVSLRMRTGIGGPAAELFFSKSIFYFSIGSNDLFLYFVNRNITQQNLFIGLLVNQFKSQLETLYGTGARKFLVSGSSLLGCIPAVRLLSPGGECSEYLNSLSLDLNRETRIALQELSSKLPGLSYTFISIYDFVTELSSDPQKYGFTEPASACCGSGRLNAESDCTPSSNYCPDRSKYIFWDSVHPTQALFEAAFRAASSGDRYASPITIQQLVLL